MLHRKFFILTPQSRTARLFFDSTAPAGDTAVSTFNFRGFDLRCVELDGKTWFAAPDVCKALGYKNPTEFTRPLDAQDKAKKFLGKGAPATLVSEAGLYQLLLRTQRTKPEAKSFQDWVTRDVLPAIRKDGGYIEGEEDVGTGGINDAKSARLVELS